MSCRTEGGFSERVWEMIDQTTDSIRAANCTARRFLEVDGPYGFGLTSVVGEEQWLQPDPIGADYRAWGVSRPEPRVTVNRAGTVVSTPRRTGDPLDSIHGGTFMARGVSRPVPLIASEFALGMRAIEAYDAGCQPLDLCPATRAARDVALEEERLVYYGYPGDSEALLAMDGTNDTMVSAGSIYLDLQSALTSLARRGYAGPFALVGAPELYNLLYTPASSSYSWPVLLVDLIRSLFRGGVYMAPVISYTRDPQFRIGAIVTVGRAFSRLIVGQDWYTAYRGRNGLTHQFLLMSSLQLRICERASIQVLRLR